MKDLVLVEMVEAVDALTQNLDGFLLSQKFSLFDIGIKIPFVAKLKDKVVVIAGFLHIVKFDDVVTLATLQHLDLALKQLLELSCIIRAVPLTFSLRMDLTAMSLLVALS